MQSTSQLDAALLQAAQVIEDQIDERLQKLDNMDDDELEKLRERRVQQLKRDQIKRQEYLAAGHGHYTEVTDQKEFFEYAKKSSRVVCHFYRPTTWRCEVIDKHLLFLAQKHIETKFIKVNAEKSPFLVERLHIIIMPSIVLIKDGKTDHTVQGFDELGGDDFTLQQFEAFLLHQKVIEPCD
jgi:hypothetical protein